MDPSEVAGIWPILYAYFDAGGRVDRDAMRRQLDAYVAGGAHGVAVMGLATEVGKLDVRERRQFVEWVAEDLPTREGRPARSPACWPRCSTSRAGAGHPSGGRAA